MRIAIAEDQRLIRELLAQVLGREADFEVVAQAATGKDAIALVRSAAPDVLVLDVGLPDMSGVDVARALHQEHAKLAIVTLSIHEEPYFVQRMIQAGADGYVVKSAALTELVQAIRSVHEGRMYLSPAITRHAIGKAAGPARLSEREAQVLALIANGYQSPAIAAKLSISAGTVEAHRRNIMTKLGLHSIAELTKYAVREGLTSS
jgi:two-component system NarL family response regulator